MLYFFKWHFLMCNLHSLFMCSSQVVSSRTLSPADILLINHALKLFMTAMHSFSDLTVFFLCSHSIALAYSG